MPTRSHPPHQMAPNFEPVSLLGVPGTPRSAVLTVYNDEGDEQLEVTVGEDVLLFYRVTPSDGADDDDKERNKAGTVAFGANIADGE